MPKTTKTKKRKPAPAAEPPEWATKTPGDIEYQLVMMDSGGDEAEQIAVTRDEYITLKQHLALLRGYVLPEVAHATK
jgi:hypothetical protein